MDDYVLESNPALERLTGRHRANGDPPPSDDSVSGHAKHARREWRSAVHAADLEILREGPSADGAKAASGNTTITMQAVVVEESGDCENDLWAVYEDTRSSDEVVLVHLDEDPEVFDEDPEYYYDDEDEVDEPDEILELHESDEPDDEDETADEHEEVFDEEDLVFDGDEADDADDELSVEAVGATQDDEPDSERFVDEVVDWILNALEDLNLEADDDAAQEDDVVLDTDDAEDVDEAEPVAAVDDASVDVESENEEIVDGYRELADRGAEVLDAFAQWNRKAVDDVEDEERDPELFGEDNADDPVLVSESPNEPADVPTALLEPPLEHDEPYHSAPSDMSSQLSVNAGRKRARHKKPSPRQMKRSLRKAEQDARKAEKSSRKAAEH
jgi:hypothetical protein